MNGFSTGTGQTQSFSEIAFAFRITPGIAMSGLGFAALMGLVGGLLPALRALGCRSRARFARPDGRDGRGRA